MLRYFIAWNLWLAAGLALVLGRGDVGHHYTVFGGGHVDPEVFWCVVAASFAVAIVCFRVWWVSLPHSMHGMLPGLPAGPARREARGFEVVMRERDGKGE
jgi:hypothetical protein